MKKLILSIFLIQSAFLLAQTKTVVTMYGEKVQINPNSISTADNGLTAATGNVQLGGTLLKPTSLVTTSSNTLALQGLQTGSNTDNILVADGSGILKWISRSSFTQAGDNLGNHIAGQTLNMNSNSIAAAKDITATGKTTTNTAAITMGTDNVAPVAGYVATAADANGNIVWKPAAQKNIVPTDIGTVIAINGELLVAQEITALMTSDFYTSNVSGPLTIGNITNVIIDNKGQFSSNSSNNSFRVAEDGVYSVTINLQFLSSGGTPVIGIWCDTDNRWVARINQHIPATFETLNMSLITSIPMSKTKTYSFRAANTEAYTIIAINTGSTGSGPVSFYSVKRLK